MLDAPDLDLPLVRLLNQEARLDLATLQALLGEVKAARANGGPTLARALVQRGLLPEADVLAALQRLGGGGAGSNVSTGSLERIGDYLLLEQLGAGGMGTVYLAQHTQTGMRYAVKLLSSASDTQLSARFEREGQAQARVDAHPNVVRVHLAGREGNRAFIVLDLAAGGSLDQRLEAGPLEPAEAVRVVAALARGLQHVHDHGVLHRDLKPANVLFDEAGTPKLVDFGLARVSGEATLTKTGAVVGTAAYMSPEQARGQHRELDGRTDVYGLGAILYAALTGQPPFQGSPASVLTQVLREQPTPPRELRPEIPPELEAVCLKALAKDPADRFQTAAQLAAALESPAPATAAPERSRLGLRLALALIPLLIGAAVLALVRERTREAAREEAGRRARALAAEAWAGLCADRPLASDAELPAAWRARGDELVAIVGPDTPELLQVEQDAAALEGLVALAGGERARARTTLKRLESLGGERPGLLALRGGVAAHGRGTELTRALPDLKRAREGGVARPELARWIVLAELRLALSELQTGKTARAIHRLGAFSSVDGIDEELVADLIQQLVRRVKVHAGSFRQLGVREDPPRTSVTELNHLFRILRVLRPSQPIPAQTFTRLFAFATETRRRVVGLAPALASLKPNDFEIQFQTARHCQYLAESPRQGRETALLYLPPTRRALKLAPDTKQRAAVAKLLCERLAEAARFRECVDFATELLDGPDFVGKGRGPVLFQRGVAFAGMGRLEDALRDFDKALTFTGQTYVYYERGLVLKELKRHRQAAQSAVEYMRGVDALFYRRTFPLAAALAWESGRLVKAHALRLQAIELLLRHFPGALYAGWRLRRALLLEATQRRPEAIASLKRALGLLPSNSRLKSLRKRTRRVLQALERDDPKAGSKLLDLVKRVERKRRPGTAIP